MKSQRSIKDVETAVLVALLQASPEYKHLLADLVNLKVVEMEDGGMGSLLLLPNRLHSSNRSLGKQIAIGEFKDSDNVPVVVAINLDKEQLLFELDVWKVDFSSLKSWPDPKMIIIHKVGEVTYPHRPND